VCATLAVFKDPCMSPLSDNPLVLAGVCKKMTDFCSQLLSNITRLTRVYSDPRCFVLTRCSLHELF